MRKREKQEDDVKNESDQEEGGGDTTKKEEGDDSDGNEAAPRAAFKDEESDLRDIKYKLENLANERMAVLVNAFGHVWSILVPQCPSYVCKVTV